MTIDIPEAPFRPSFYSPEVISDEEADIVLAAIARELDTEFAWHQEYRQRFPEPAFKPFESRDEIYEAYYGGYLDRVKSGEHFKLIHRLESESPEYSPPFLRPQTLVVLEFIARETMAGFDPDERLRLSVTSLIRDEGYQAHISDKQPRRPAVGNVGELPKGSKSSHVFGLAFDIDGSGYYHGEKSVHPRKPGYDEDYNVAIHDRLKLVLGYLSSETSLINVVNELPGYSEEVFHVGVNPMILDLRTEDVERMLEPLSKAMAEAMDQN